MHSINEFFPVNLILKGRSCLVVGGGKVGTRKLEKLLLAGAEISVISPVVSEFISALADSGKIKLIPREFQKTDTRGFSLVFAATNNKDVNKKVIKRCNKKGILCCAVDKNWESGSFVTPASFSKGDFSISVSSNGKKCKESKQIKNILKSALDKSNDCKPYKP